MSVNKTKTMKTPKKRSKWKTKNLPLAERQKLVDEIMGKYAWIPYSSEDFNRDKRREIALENRS